ncbi:hypothetical protein METHPM2_500002 [Pseudomonas sp. PM2]
MALRTNAIFKPLSVMTSEGPGPCRELKEALNEQGGQHEQSDIPQRLPADALAFSPDGLRGQHGRPRQHDRPPVRPGQRRDLDRHRGDPVRHGDERG